LAENAVEFHPPLADYETRICPESTIVRSCAIEVPGQDFITCKFDDGR
jgi:hypothetical protein